MSDSIFTRGKKEKNPVEQKLHAHESIFTISVEKVFHKIIFFGTKICFNKTVFFKNKNMSLFNVKINKDGISKIFGFQISLYYVYVKTKILKRW